jgi:hypothetical protein
LGDEILRRLEAGHRLADAAAVVRIARVRYGPHSKFLRAPGIVSLKGKPQPRSIHVNGRIGLCDSCQRKTEPTGFHYSHQLCSECRDLIWLAIQRTMVEQAKLYKPELRRRSSAL